MKQLTIILSIIACIFLSACTDATSPDRVQNLSYVISGSLYAGKSVESMHPIFIGQTANVNGGSFNNLIITNAIVVLKDTNTNEQTILTYTNPSDSSRIGYYDAYHQMLIVPGHTYRIDVLIPNSTNTVDTVWAETIVPAPITIQPNAGYAATLPATLDAYPTMKYKRIDQDYPLFINTNNDNIVNILMESYCLEDYQNAEFLFTFMGSPTHPEEYEDYESVMDGSPRLSKWTTSYKPEFINNLYTIRDASYSTIFNFYGRQRLSIYATDDNYYKYNYMTEGFRHGGIHNGIGYFGSLCGQEFYTRIIK